MTTSSTSESGEKCENCGSTERASIFRGERFCSAFCKKALGLDKTSEMERLHNELHPAQGQMTELEKHLLRLVGFLSGPGKQSYLTSNLSQFEDTTVEFNLQTATLTVSPPDVQVSSETQTQKQMTELEKFLINLVGFLAYNTGVSRSIFMPGVRKFGETYRTEIEFDSGTDWINLTIERGKS